jgi:hypothetical protein
MDQQAREQAFISALTTEQFVLQAWWFRRREQCAVGWRVASLGLAAWCVPVKGVLLLARHSSG